jgi:low temperature requirement protein LtrA
MTAREQRVTPLELFFDLVFVYAITQVTLLMSGDPTWQGLGRGLIALAAVWWAWSGYTWFTNMLEPEEGLVRTVMFAAMAVLLVVALALPDAFGDDALLFGIAYLVVRLLQLLLYAIAAKRDPDLVEVVARKLPAATVAPVLILAAAFFDGAPQAGLWLAALAVDYLGALVSHRRAWRISPAHFAERHGLIVIIALGESIVAIGIGASGTGLTASIVAASVLGILAVAALWWAYFDVYAVGVQQRLASAEGELRARFARDCYSYLHLPMVAGIVLFALGLKKTIEHVDDPLATVPAVALCGGLSLYFLTHVALRIRLVWTTRRTSDERPGWIGPGRVTAAIVTLALIPAAVEVPALASLALVTAVCCALIVYDVVHYREDRVRVREARP